MLLKDAAGVEKGSGVPNKDKVGTLKVEDLRKIVEEKGKELTGLSEDAMVRTLAGTARSMGIVVEGLEEVGM